MVITTFVLAWRVPHPYVAMVSTTFMLPEYHIHVAMVSTTSVLPW